MLSGRRPLGYRRFKEFVQGKDLPATGVDVVLDESDLPRGRPDGFTLLRARNSLLWLPFVHIYNTLRYTLVARVIGVLLCLALLLTGSWLAVMKNRVSRQEEWLAGRDNLVIAVMGKDDVEGMGRSDTLILVNFKYNDKKLNILSIPRDSRVPIRRTRSDGTTYFKFSKINHALRWGGVALTKETVERYLGITIDYHLIISYGLFVEMIDFMGGVPIDVEKRMYYVDRAGGLTIDLRPGFQVLDGNRALQYVRFRHDHHGDIGRIKRQQKFIKAAAEHIKKPENFLRLARNAPKLLKHISTDIPVSLALPLLYRFRDVNLKRDLRLKTLPGTERSLPLRPGGKRYSFYVSTYDQVEKTVNDWFLQVKSPSERVKPNPLAFPDLKELLEGGKPTPPAATGAASSRVGAGKGAGGTERRGSGGTERKGAGGVASHSRGGASRAGGSAGTSGPVVRTAPSSPNGRGSARPAKASPAARSVAARRSVNERRAAGGTGRSPSRGTSSASAGRNGTTGSSGTGSAR